MVRTPSWGFKCDSVESRSTVVDSGRQWSTVVDSDYCRNTVELSKTVDRCRTLLSNCRTGAQALSTPGDWIDRLRIILPVSGVDGNHNHTKLPSYFRARQGVGQPIDHEVLWQVLRTIVDEDKQRELTTGLKLLHWLNISAVVLTLEHC